MKKIIVIIVFVQISIVQYGQIIADHTIVDDYDIIPQQYIDKVKKMLVNIGGMSHGMGYINGVGLLELYDSKFQVLTYTTDPAPVFSDQYLRFGRPVMMGETFFTSQSTIDVIKTYFLRDQYNSGNPFDVFGFGWSYQGTWVNPPGGDIDPVYNVHWAGSSESGPDGDKRWGLDKGDSILTGNRICMDSYLKAMEQYRKYNTDNSYPTIMLFTNGCVDSNSGTEAGFQRELKNQHIRDYIAGKAGYYFFDYADILIYNNAGVHNSVNWNDGGNLRAHDQIHPENLMDYDGSWNIITPEPDAAEDHIGEVGALRLGKAIWWMLARIAGWDGNIATGTSDIDSDPDKGTSLKVTVNSNIDELKIQIDESLMNGKINLYNINGLLIATRKADRNANTLNTSQFPSGLYLVSVSKSKITKTQKIIIP